ncbi:MAG TPA: class I SAM-dependent methyltransferase [Kiloniellales bacterium]|jgi:SAM-dependent methyltransferase
MTLVEHQRTLYTSRNPTRRWLHTSRRDWILSAIRRHAPARRTRAIEIGPGSGVYLPLLLELFDQVTAFDIEAQYLDAAQSLAADHPALRIEHGDVTATAGADAGTYDLVLCSEVVEHIPPAQSAAAFAGFRRLLAEGGVLVLSTPHRWSAIETTARIALSPAMIWLTRLVYREPVLEMGHINLLTRGQVEHALHDAGFEIVERHAGGFYLPVLAELFGEGALKLEQWLESRVRGGPLHQLLWTQYYVARARM